MKRLTVAPLVAATYFMVSGGPYGLEEIVAGAGYLGAILDTGEGIVTVAFQPGAPGQIAAIYLVANPDKLRAVRPAQA